MEIQRTATARPEATNLKQSSSVPSPSMPKAVAWTIGTLASMLTMAIAARELSGELQPHHMALYRNIICLVILLGFIVVLGPGLMRTRHLRMHVARNTVHFFAQWGWLFGLGTLPLTEVFAIEFSAPIWAALLAVLFLGERLTRIRAIAIGLGFAGILVLLRPGLAIVDPASIVVLGAAVGYGVAYVITKSLTGADSALTVVFWMNLIQLPLGAAMSVNDLVWPSPALVPWTLALGVVGFTSHYCLTQALRYADVSIVAPMDFFRLPLAALISWFVYHEALDPYLAAGGILVLLGNWINLRRR